MNATCEFFLKAQSAITISGLAIGLTCAILMFLFVREE